MLYLMKSDIKINQEVGVENLSFSELSICMIQASEEAIRRQTLPIINMLPMIAYWRVNRPNIQSKEKNKFQAWIKKQRFEMFTTPTQWSNIVMQILYQTDFMLIFLLWYFHLQNLALSSENKCILNKRN